MNRLVLYQAALLAINSRQRTLYDNTDCPIQQLQLLKTGDDITQLQMAGCDRMLSEQSNYSH